MEEEDFRGMFNIGMTIVIIGFLIMVLSIMASFTSWQSTANFHVTTALSSDGAPTIVYELEQARDLLADHEWENTSDFSVLIDEYRGLENVERAHMYHETIFSLHVELKIFQDDMPSSAYWEIRYIGFIIIIVGMVFLMIGGLGMIFKEGK